jgi:hypothetical protein
MWTDVSEERIVSIFKVENQPSMKEDGLGRFSTLKMAICSPETSVHIRTIRRYIAEDGNIRMFT